MDAERAYDEIFHYAKLVYDAYVEDGLSERHALLMTKLLFGLFILNWNKLEKENK